MIGHSAAIDVLRRAWAAAFSIDSGGNLNVPNRLDKRLALDVGDGRLNLKQRCASGAVILDIAAHRVPIARRRQFGQPVLVNAATDAAILVIAFGRTKVLIALATGDREALRLLDYIQAFVNTHNRFDSISCQLARLALGIDRFGANKAFGAHCLAQCFGLCLVDRFQLAHRSPRHRVSARI